MAQQPDLYANPIISKLMQPLSQPANGAVTRGSIVMFPYYFYKNDSSPIVLVTDPVYQQKLRGINLHYLTFNTVRGLIEQYANNPNFTYRQFARDIYVSSAFRSYKWAGIETSRLRKVDSQFIMQIASIARSTNITEIRAIEQLVRQQIQQQMNPTAGQISGQ